MRTTPLEEKIKTIAVPISQDMGLDIVQVRIIGDGGSRNVQIMAENPKTRRLSIDQCTKLSKALSIVFDVEDPIDGAYRLEVSSPGIDRPLTQTKDFKEYKGFEAKLETDKPLENGQKRFKGRIAGITDNIVKLTTEAGDVELDFDSLVKAQLVLNDELINATANGK